MVDVPPTLLRFFDKNEYAQRFIGGELRFGRLERYRQIEGSRNDQTEGHVDFEWNLKAPQFVIEAGRVVPVIPSDQNIRYTGSSLDTYFILSATHPDVDVRPLADKFGQFKVRITNPLLLLERIRAVWQQHPWAWDGCAFIAPAVYNKGGLLDPDPYLIPPHQYSYSQKPKSFEDEREYRYCLVCRFPDRQTPEDYVTLQVQDCSDILMLEGQVSAAIG